ncbi:MAG TPA: hypothetical protein VN661_03505 [Candidatus Acidoferrales bacterium]|nr:hypothetical protein [Candidatus Acidoferrales bacterium]
MPLDALDQATVSRLPRLSELRAAYGVRVNEVDVDELFGLYESTGFLYPEKASRLLPHLDLVKENWCRMLRAGESLLYVLIAGNEERGRAALAVWRTSRHGWTYQHLVSENNPVASRAVMLAAEAESILKGSDESAQNWYRPENRFPARVFGSMTETIGGALSSTQRYAYLALPRTQSLPSEPGVHVVPYDSSRNRDLCAIAALTKGNVYVTAEELKSDVPFKAVDALYRRAGLRRTRQVWLAYRKGTNELIGAAMAYRGPLGLNFSYLENRCDLLLSPRRPAEEVEAATTSLLAVAATAYEDFELGDIPVIAPEEIAPFIEKAGAQFLRRYCQCIWLKEGYARSYRHVDGFYSKMLARSERHSLELSSALQETR